MKIEYVQGCWKGHRQVNEDATGILDMRKNSRYLAVVCDGMGGYSKGEEASKAVTRSIIGYWSKHTRETDSVHKVGKACRKAAIALKKRSYALRGALMGTTMALASIEGPTLTIAHMGDTRCYVYRPSIGLLYVTTDHVKKFPGNGGVTRCFLSHRTEIPKADVDQLELRSGDRILLCTDGVHKVIDAGKLSEILTEKKPLKTLLDDVFDICVTSGYDNATAILIQVI